MPQPPASKPNPWARMLPERVAALAAEQKGVVHRDQLVVHGISGSTISRWEAARWLHRLYPSVYALGHRSLGCEGRLRGAGLYAGEGAVLSHLSAAAWWELVAAPP